REVPAHRQGREAPWRQEGGGREDRLPALPPARRGSEARGSGARGWPGAQLPDSTLGRLGEVEQHRVARAPALEPARRQGRARIRLGGGRYGPPRPRQAAPGQHLPVRAQARRRGEDRRALRPTRPGARERHAHHQQDTEGDEDDAHEKVLAAVMASRGRQKDLSYFAFTATPKAKTLELFGTRDAEGQPRPFHLYSMRQAIEEGFILDVLKNYTTYK